MIDGFTRPEALRLAPLPSRAKLGTITSAMSDQYLRESFLSEAMQSLREHGFYVTTKLVRPTSQALASLLRSELKREVAHMVWPPWAAVDIYFLPDSELVDLEELHRLGESLAGDVPQS